MIEHLKEKLNDYYLSLQSQILNKQSYYENLLKSDEEYVALTNELGALNLQIAKYKYNDFTVLKIKNVRLYFLQKKCYVHLRKKWNCDII